MPQHIFDEIKNYLLRHGSGTANELSHALGVTRADVHHHLKKMSQAHLLVRNPSTETSSPQRGRRPYRFSLSSTTYPDNLTTLSQAILALVKEKIDINNIWKEIANRMIGNVPRRTYPPAILNFATSWLNKHNYNARWEARQSGPCIILQNCPYRSLLSEFPEICQLDYQIISIMTGYVIMNFTQKKQKDGYIYSCHFGLSG